MSMKVIRTGDEPEISQAVLWLERFGITRNMIKSVNIYAEVGAPLLIQPTLMVPDPAEVLINVKADPLENIHGRGRCGDPTCVCAAEPSRKCRRPGPRSPRMREMCPCGAGFEHAVAGDQEQHADWLERHNEP
jgi:hypothetical protein